MRKAYYTGAALSRGVFQQNHSSAVTRFGDIITTAANEIMKPIHDRMPAIVPKAFWQEWLSDGPENVLARLGQEANRLEIRPLLRREADSVSRRCKHIAGVVQCNGG